MDRLIIRGARQHNLKNINLELPKNKLIVFTGLSGSGKSSLAFDTIYAEGQRRYVESLSSYARQFLGIMDKPDVDSIEGLSPSISIDQKSASHNPRSTVGTVTEIYDYLRLLFARIGHPHCPVCGREIAKQSSQQIVDQILKEASRTLTEHTSRQYRFLILSPVVRDRKGEFSGLFENLRAKGYRQARVDRHFFSLDEELVLIKTNKHSIDVVVDKISLDRKKVTAPELRSRITDSVDQALALSEGIAVIGEIGDTGFTIPDKPKKVHDHIYSEKFSCPVDNISLAEIEPRSFSFNSPQGACPTCSGIGTILTVDPDLVMRPELSITEGGILPFARMFFHDTWFSRVVSTVAQRFGINQRAPLKLMTPKQKDVLLHGTGDTLYRVVGTNRFGDTTTIEEKYPGIIAELKRRYIESESDFVRAEIEKYMREEVCAICAGKRLKKEFLTVTIDQFSIADVTELSISDCLEWVRTILTKTQSDTEKTIGAPIVKEIKARLTFLSAVGLDYLTLGRAAMTLSSGEAQRIRLASQIGSGLSGVLYVLDEPSIGLHQKDNSALIHTLKMLRDLGNTVIVVEHDRETMEEADHIVDFGPGAGHDGGAIVAQGTLDKIKGTKSSITGQFLTGKRTISRPRQMQIALTNRDVLTLVEASQNNLKKIDVSFPLGKFICITGVSGSGKSTLIVETLYRALFAHFNPFTKDKPGAHKEIKGLEHIDKVILIDQSPIGRTPRSNPATYTGIFSVIREIFAMTNESRLRGYKTGRFSFNVKGGRCETCEGEGQKKIEMQFLSDIYVTCEVCRGYRYNAETLEVLYHGKNIAQVLDMTVEEALAFFTRIPSLSEKMKTIFDVGLGYIHLGQPAPTLSGGEAQRVKIATELSRRATGRTVYILDEPTTGLHFADLEKLLHVLHRLTELGNTVIVIEHNLDVVKNADWIIDLGPDGGDKGGEVVAVGSPRDIAKIKQSYTGQFLMNL
ncbi:MAG: excinuclease ABC subunit UvrA, partial [Candidatus Gottesmanbacteria bacterium]|nr:excinuclease ABC subunit UvrA [Candidatus Gottesmanbacteria bacterium]